MPFSQCSFTLPTQYQVCQWDDWKTSPSLGGHVTRIQKRCTLLLWQRTFYTYLLSWKKGLQNTRTHHKEFRRRQDWASVWTCWDPVQARNCRRQGHSRGESQGKNPQAINTVGVQLTERSVFNFKHYLESENPWTLDPLSKLSGWVANSAPHLHENNGPIYIIIVHKVSFESLLMHLPFFTAQFGVCL